MLACDAPEVWTDFLEAAKGRCSSTAFHNWLEPIRPLEVTSEQLVLEVPNTFVQDYLLNNFQEELKSFLPLDAAGELAIRFVVAKREKESTTVPLPSVVVQGEEKKSAVLRLNGHYRFDSYIEGPHNQFVKSAAIGVASHPGKSYNPLFIHGGVGLGKTHLLHSIGHYVQAHTPRVQVQCITTEGFINELVDNLRGKSVDKMKRFYRSNLDVLLVDDIQFLQNRLNFEEEFCNMFETLIHQHKQIVITSDKPPAQLRLSERMIARMEWGLVAYLDIPNLETRVAILQHKAEQRGLRIPQNVAFYLAENLDHNVRQLEGAVNRLSAFYRFLQKEITLEMVQESLKEMFRATPREKVTVEQILRSVASVFEVSVQDLKKKGRAAEVVLPRQVAMYLARELVEDSVTLLGASFGKTHSTVLHAHKAIEQRLTMDDTLSRQIQMVRRHLCSG